MTNKGATETINKGKVIFINCFHLDAPSITAASYKSSGILCKDPKVIVIIYGKPSQVFTTNTATFAQKGSFNHFIGLIPKFPRTKRLITP
jgi:hypothetical protein